MCHRTKRKQTSGTGRPAQPHFVGSSVGFGDGSPGLSGVAQGYLHPKPRIRRPRVLAEASCGHVAVRALGSSRVFVPKAAFKSGLGV